MRRTAGASATGDGVDFQDIWTQDWLTVFWWVEVHSEEREIKLVLAGRAVQRTKPFVQNEKPRDLWGLRGFSSSCAMPGMRGLIRS